MEPKKETAQEPNWTELLEKEQGRIYPDLIQVMRADGHTDKEIYSILNSFG